MRDIKEKKKKKSNKWQFIKENQHRKRQICKKEEQRKGRLRKQKMEKGQCISKWTSEWIFPAA